MTNKYKYNCSYCYLSTAEKYICYGTNNKSVFNKHCLTPKHIKNKERNEYDGKNVCEMCGQRFNDYEFECHKKLNKEYLNLDEYDKKRLFPNGFKCGEYRITHEFCPNGKLFSNMDEFNDFCNSKMEAEDYKETIKGCSDKGNKWRHRAYKAAGLIEYVAKNYPSNGKESVSKNIQAIFTNSIRYYPPVRK